MDYPRALDSSPEDRGLGVRDCIRTNANLVPRVFCVSLSASYLRGWTSGLDKYKEMMISFSIPTTYNDDLLIGNDVIKTVDSTKPPGV